MTTATKLSKLRFIKFRGIYCLACTKATGTLAMQGMQSSYKSFMMGYKAEIIVYGSKEYNVEGFNKLICVQEWVHRFSSWLKESLLTDQNNSGVLEKSSA